MIIMNRPSISTIIVIICILIIGLYAAGEVNYFAHKTVTEKNITSPVVMVDKVGINEKMNNQSLDLGVMIDEKSSIPTKGDVVIFGHRTLQGSPFLRLNELENGDIITLEWPGVGEVNYTVTNKTIVPATYHLNVNETGESNAWIISGAFLIVGLIISFVYPKESRPYILATVLIISIILFYFCFNPISSQAIYDKIIFMNGGM